MPRNEGKRDEHGTLIEGTYGSDPSVPIKVIVPKSKEPTKEGGASNGTGSTNSQMA